LVARKTGLPSTSLAQRGGLLALEVAPHLSSGKVSQRAVWMSAAS
jgi:hypothetical protein